MKEHQQKVINELRDEGYLVCIWTPEELADCNTHHVENRIIELGNEVIVDLRGTE